MSAKQGIFISGADTNIGKTVTSALLLSALASHGKCVGYFKPVQTGDDSDTQTVTRLTGLSQDSFANPVYEFPEPLAPSRAARLNHTEIRLEAIQRNWTQLSPRHWVIEGAGGLLVPLNSEKTIRDLVRTLEVGLLLVSSTRLGTINHTLLSLEAAQSACIAVRGVALVGDPDEGLEEAIGDFTDVPILARIPRLPEITPAWIREFSTRCFTADALKRIFAGEGGLRG